jgi:DNA adenine methylase
MVKKEVPTFVKWAGGKKQLLEQFKSIFPDKIERYHEPFIGGGAVAFYVLKNHKPKEIYLSDINEELTTCLNVIKNDVDALVRELHKLKAEHGKEQYYKVRAKSPERLSAVERAARFIYLNKTCFNGLYRVNSKGGFNVPIGSYVNPSIFDETELREISELLKDVIIETKQFYEILNHAKKGDFIYFDPPYYPLNKTSSFTTYTKEAFLEKEQEKLAEVFKELDKKGCKVMLSNSNTSFIKKLYAGYNVKIVKAARMINCDGKGRGKINEIVVTNYSNTKEQGVL